MLLITWSRAVAALMAPLHIDLDAILGLQAGTDVG